MKQDRFYELLKKAQETGECSREIWVSLLYDLVETMADIEREITLPAIHQLPFLISQSTKRQPLSLWWSGQEKLDIYQQNMMSWRGAFGTQGAVIRDGNDRIYTIIGIGLSQVMWIQVTAVVDKDGWHIPQSQHSVAARNPKQIERLLVDHPKPEPLAYFAVCASLLKVMAERYEQKAAMIKAEALRLSERTTALKTLTS